MIDIDSRTLMNRMAALALLALLFALVSPIVASPVFRYLDMQAALDQEAAFLEKAETRLALARSVAANAPVLTATNRNDALSAVVAGLAAAAPQMDMRILSATPLTPDAPDSRRIDVTATVEATPAGLMQFLVELPKHQLSISALSIVPQDVPDANTKGRPVRLSVHLTASAIFSPEKGG